MDTWGAPQRIIDAHAPDQGPQICLDLRPTAKASRFPAPIPAKAGTMPAHDGLGPDDRDDLEDRRKPTIELDQEQAIAVRKVEATAHLSLQYNKLTSKGVLAVLARLGRSANAPSRVCPPAGLNSGSRSSRGQIG